MEVLSTSLIHSSRSAAFVSTFVIQLSLSAPHSIPFMFTLIPCPRVGVHGSLVIYNYMKVTSFHVPYGRLSQASFYKVKQIELSKETHIKWTKDKCLIDYPDSELGYHFGIPFKV